VISEYFCESIKVYYTDKKVCYSILSMKSMSKDFSSFFCFLTFFYIKIWKLSKKCQKLSVSNKYFRIFVNRFFKKKNIFSFDNRGKKDNFFHRKYFISPSSLFDNLDEKSF